MLDPVLNPDHLLTLARSYASRLRVQGVHAVRANLEQLGAPRDRQLSHCLWLLDQVPILIDEGKLAKASRWISWVQGVLWSQGLTTVNKLREETRPIGWNVSPRADDDLEDLGE